MKALPGKRVVMLLQNSAYSQDNRVRQEANSLTKAGYCVTVICPILDNGLPWRYTTPEGVRIYRYPFHAFGTGAVGYFWEYGYTILVTFLISLFIYLSDGFDIVHTHNPPDMFVIIAAFYQLLGKRFVYDHHDLSPEMFNERFHGKGNPLLYRLLVGFEKLSCRRADHVIATNQSYKEIEMSRGGVPEERITIVRNGPDLNRLRPVPPDSALRQKAAMIIGYVGWMGVQDGIDNLLYAINHLVKDLGRTDFYCVLIGKGEALSSMQALAKELEIDTYVWFTGRIPDADMVRYLCTTDICVDPDPFSPFTNHSTMIKMMEYMALGKPIVAFDLKEHRRSAEDAAVYAKPNDRLDFAKKIAMLMDDPRQRQRMATRGRERIDTQLAWFHQEQHLLDAYAKLNSRYVAEDSPQLSSSNRT